MSAGLRDDGENTESPGELLDRLDHLVSMLSLNGQHMMVLLQAMDRKIDVLEKRIEKLENEPRSIPEYLPR